MDLRAYLSGHFLLLDGGMGTQLQERGLAAGERPERWNVTHADDIRSIHRAYLAAGSQVLYANTFGANRLHFSDAELEEVIAAGIRLAREAIEAERPDGPAFIALDVGPTGRLLKPLGDLDFEDAVSVFAQVVRLGARHGADLIVIETMGDSYETKAALLAARENSDLPVFVTNVYGRDGKMMTGADAEAMVALLEGLGADAIGLNCSEGPAALLPVAKQYLACSSLPVIFKPNAGLPRLENGATVYDVPPAEFASVMREAAKSGVRIFGGCCGTTPAHIAALRRALEGLSPLPVEPKNRTWVSSYTHAVTFGARPVLIGERINPTGKKRLKEALRSHDLDYLLDEGIREQENGADILDVNVGLPEINEPELLTEAVVALQQVVDLPLQLDTANPAAMEAALRRYNGRALINSVSGKEESLRAILPLAKKYGGLVVALTLDENGIPETAAGRVAVARRILEVGKEYGLAPCDFLFDPLAMTVSADVRSPGVTLDALRMIRDELGCHTSLGISNVSFGLPSRDAVNSAFFAMALREGLSAAIYNPDSVAMRAAYHAFLALSGKDPDCAAYLSFVASLPVAPVAAPPAAAVAASSAPTAPSEENAWTLRGAIVGGMRDRAGQLAKDLLSSRDAMDLINADIIPALDEVGRGFESGRVYLPQLLMSAEAAGSAFEVIRAATVAARGEVPKRCTVVLATVAGDIHDIGKNIVRLLLENYGFHVLDLGRDVPPEKILEATVASHAPLVGLSALMTTTVPAMEATVRLLHEKAPWCRVMVGGAVLNADYAAAMGADSYSPDAMGAVRYAEEIDRK